MTAHFLRIFTIATFATVLMCRPGGAVIFNLEASLGGSDSAFPNASYGFLVADMSGDGFQFLSNTSLLTGVRSAAENSLIGGVGDDLIFATNLIRDSFGAGLNGFTLNQRTFDTTPANAAWGTNDNFALVWLPTGTSNTGDSFGFYRTNSVSGVLGSNVSFITPGAGSYSLFDLSTGAGGTTGPTAYTANNGTIAAVPEPSVILLIAFAPILVKLFRVLRTRAA